MINKLVSSRKQDRCVDDENKLQPSAAFWPLLVITQNNDNDNGIIIIIINNNNITGHPVKSSLIFFSFLPPSFKFSTNRNWPLGFGILFLLWYLLLFWYDQLVWQDNIYGTFWFVVVAVVVDDVYSSVLCYKNYRLGFVLLQRAKRKRCSWNTRTRFWCCFSTETLLRGSFLRSCYWRATTFCVELVSDCEANTSYLSIYFSMCRDRVYHHTTIY